MVELKAKKIKREEIFSGQRIKLWRDTVELPSGKQATREVVGHPGAATIIAVTKDKKIVFVRQYRQATEEVLLEIPAGIPDQGETFEACAKRELEEETGFKAGKIRKIWEGYATPGYSNELIRFFLAEDLEQVGQHTEEDEFIEVEMFSVKECHQLVLQGKIKDNKTLIGITIANGL